MANQYEREHENGVANDHTIVPSPAPADLPAYTNEKDSPSLSFNGKGKDIDSTDRDLGLEPTTSTEEGEEGEGGGTIRRYYNRYGIFVHLFCGMVMTGWWIAGLVLHRDDIGWLKPFLLWLAITIRLVTFHISTKYITKPIAFVWVRAVKRPSEMIPQKLRIPLAAAGTIAVIIVGTFVSEETADNTRPNRAVSLFGLLVFIGAFYVTSRNRKAVNWQTVIVGMLAQFILALFVLRTKAGYDIFNFIAELATDLLGFAAKGTLFLTGQKALDSKWFLVGVIPPIIFFVAFVQLLYYWGWLQWSIKKFATIFFYTMGVSGAEAVVAAASPFVGQGESAMLIKPFIPHLTDAELHQIMTSGFATIAGSVLAAYIAMGISPLALVSSCVMSIPASLAISKLRWPETEESLTAGQIVIPASDEERPTNSLHAFANGSWLGIKIAGMIVAGLLCILALIGLVNGILNWWGNYLNIPSLSVELILGYLFYPVAFLLGVERNGDLLKVAKLIGTKVVTNEFVAFNSLATDKDYADLSDRSRLIATYAVCGFGNISSVGIQIGVLSQLAPGRSGRVAKVAMSALISGVIATLTSASIAGMLVADQSVYTKVTIAPSP
ncbi:putative concentrative Na+-nucleoside cotransporter CNT1 [Venustampulla echinocandica]|uniref:Putative concentrative Na+-nucleoside cotransporter CNT1 n=1 Tax=Venustampulla echinocandica TaxID=2656787 RepID=A0A370T9B9_9HELO|nr:putative concentrative Na+-nucleoside cotransporter CNT1 [Venustampulla echinocandica]RDL30158.1 putative concentrative Na+-nucleoside cotransporter CNT1 [Venustampulla echinocandica]